MEKDWTRKIRRTTICLLFSSALNIGLIATCWIQQVRSRSFSFDGTLQKNSEEKALSNHSLLSGMSKLSFRELVAFLTNRDLVEDGYTKRDLALAALVAFRHFNLEKALGGFPEQKRTIILASSPLFLYPGLGEEQFEAIIRFAYKEKWPLTPKGLFELLQKLPSQKEESLCQAFCMTSEFCALQLLFQKTDAAQDVATLIDLATDGTWEILSGFAKEQAQLLDLSVDKRRRLLLSFLAQRSQTAAKLLLKTDFEFAFKRLDDRGICDLLSLIKERSFEGEKFCTALLQSARSDIVRKSAAEKLHAFTGELHSQSVDIEALAAKVAHPPKSTEVLSPTAPNSAPMSVKSISYHTVSEGDTLWKIARQYKVRVEDIIQLNGIENGRLYPGMTLQIP